MEAACQNATNFKIFPTDRQTDKPTSWQFIYNLQGGSSLAGTLFILFDLLLLSHLFVFVHLLLLSYLFVLFSLLHCFHCCYGSHCLYCFYCLYCSIVAMVPIVSIVILFPLFYCFHCSIVLLFLKSKGQIGSEPLISTYY